MKLFNKKGAYGWQWGDDRYQKFNDEEFVGNKYNSAAKRLESKDPQKIKKSTVPIGRIGVTIHDSKGFKEQFMQASRLGAKSVELSSSVASLQNANMGVENYGTTKRRELREMSRASGVKINSVHAPSSISNIAGFSQQQNGSGYSEQSRAEALKEVRKAIDFAKDVSYDGGASIVVHLGEHSRSIQDANKYMPKDKEGKDLFKGQFFNSGGRFFNKKVDKGELADKYGTYYENEFMLDDKGNPLKSFDDEVLTFINKENGQVAQVPTSRKFKLPVNSNVGIYSELDADGKKSFKEDFANGLSRISNTNKEITYNDVKQYENRFNNSYREKLSKAIDSKDDSKISSILSEIKGSNVADELSLFYDSDNKKILNSKDVLFKLFTEDQYRSASSQKKRVENQIERATEQLNSLIDEEHRWDNIIKRYKETHNGEEPDPIKDSKLFVFDDPDNSYGNIKPMLKTEFYKKKIDMLQKNIASENDSIRDVNAKLQDIEKTRTNYIDPLVYSEKKTASSLASLGIHAMKKTQELRSDYEKQGLMKKEQALKEVKPFFIAPENIGPETFGGHPEELIKAVKSGRAEMARQLVNNGKDEKEANKLAKEHIKATFDTQHLYLWRNHFNGSDEEFNKWYLYYVKRMQDEGILGNIHFLDSQARGHTHIPVGEGMAPLKEVAEILQETDYKGTWNQEGFAYGLQQQLTGAWELLGSPIGMGTDSDGDYVGSSWNDYRMAPMDYRMAPNWVVPPDYPDKEKWRSWSKVSLD
jgi:hypothetical protein